MRLQPLLISALGLSTLLLVGCHSTQGYSHSQPYHYRDVAPLHDDFGHARSLVLTTPVVRTAQRPLPNHHAPWYASRRDVGPFVTAGTISLRHEQSVTYTTDRQLTINGRVYDRYEETTRRRTYRDSTR